MSNKENIQIKQELHEEASEVEMIEELMEEVEISEESDQEMDQEMDDASGKESDEEEEEERLSFGDDEKENGIQVIKIEDQGIVYLENEDLPPRPVILLSELDRELCNFKPNIHQDETVNKYLSVAHETHIESGMLYNWNIGDSGVPEHQTGIDVMTIMQTVVAVSEFRELARYMRIAPSQFLDSYFKVTFPSNKLEVLRLKAEEVNEFSTKLRLNRANIFFPNLTAKMQKEIYEMDLFVDETDKKKWRRFYKIMNWPQPLNFPSFPDCRNTYREHFDTIAHESDHCFFKIHFHININSQFLSIPFPTDTHKRVWTNGKWPVSQYFKADPLNTVILVSELREYARFHRISPSLMFKDYYQTNCEAQEGRIVDPKKLNWLATKLRASRAGASIPYFIPKEQAEIYHLDLVPTETWTWKWKKFYQIFNWQLPTGGNFPIVKWERRDVRSVDGWEIEKASND